MPYSPLGFGAPAPSTVDDTAKLEISTQTSTTTVNATGGNSSVTSAGRTTLNHSAAIVLAAIATLWLAWYSLK